MTIGIAMPRIMIAVAVLDVVLRFIPAASLPTFMAGNTLSRLAASYAPFSPNIHVGWDGHVGDLQALGNFALEPIIGYNNEIDSDAFGYRNSQSVVDSMPVDLLLLGTSFAVAGDTEKDTLAGQIASQTGHSVYNGAAYGENSYRLENWLRTADRVLRPGGTVVLEYLERLDLPTQKLGLRANPCGYVASGSTAERVCLALQGYIGVSPLSNALHSVYKGMQNGSLLPNPNQQAVVEEQLGSGQKELFYRQDVERYFDPRQGEGKTVEFLASVDGQFRERGRPVLIVLNPSKYTVLRPLLKGYAREAADVNLYLSRVAQALGERGVEAIDLTPAMRAGAAAAYSAGKASYWWDDTHWNDLGIAQAATAVSAALQHQSR